MVYSPLFKLWIFEIDFLDILIFLLGILCGAMLFGLVYAIFVLLSLKNKDYIIKSDENLTTEKVKELILESQNQFLDSSLRQSQSRMSYCKDICADLVYAISSSYFPDKKYPMLELSIDETLMLTKYITKRVEEILDKKGIRLLKKLKVSSIFAISKKTSKAMDSKAFKVTKEITKISSVATKVLNVVTAPVALARKLIWENTINIITNKMCLIIIAIVGEETYKIYSKTVFKKDVDIDSDIDMLVNSIDEDIKTANSDNKEQNNPVKQSKKYLTRCLKVENSLIYQSNYDNNHKILKKMEE